MRCPVGETRLPIHLSARYNECSPNGNEAGTSPTCVGDPPDPPPLPAGAYSATFVGNIPGLPLPAAVTIQVTAADS